MDWPRITIIIPSYNQASFLEEAMCSVLDQRYPALEMMVFDGGSRDGSKHIIEKYSRYLTAWYCEPDDGQSAAIDFGMSLASGVLAGWLNSDDILLPESLVSVAEAYGSSPEGGIFGGNLVFVDTGGKITGFLRMPKNPARFARLGVFAISGPGSFFRPRDYFTAGRIRRDFHYLMDNELYMRMLLKGATFVYIDRYIAAFRRHPEQKTAGLEKVLGEAEKLDSELRAQGIRYRTGSALFFYYLVQTMNGNYWKKRLHAHAAKGLHWKHWFRETHFL